MVIAPQTIEGYALSAQQEHLWLLHAGQNTAYHSQGLYLLEGTLDVGRLRQALEVVLNRHEILRTRFKWLEGMDLPLQIIAPEARVQMERLDLSDLTDHEQQVQTQALYDRLRDLPLWNADQLPLQTHLVTLGARRHLLLVHLPALCADVAALNNLMREISGCYAACSADAPLPDESLQYVDYTEWQQEVITAEGAHVGLKHWQQDWSAARSSELPFRRLKGRETRSFEPASIAVDLDIEAIGRIQKQSPDDVSVRDVLFSSWQVLLWRVVGSEGIVVAVAGDGRKYQELQSAIGLYERYLPVRLSLSGDQRMADAVSGARAELLDAYRFQDYYSWKTSGESLATSNEAPTHAFVFEYHVAGSPESMAEDLRISLPRWSVYPNRFDVRLSCVERGDVLTCEIHYDRSSVLESDAKRLGEELRALITSAAAQPHASIGTLNILSAEERQQLLTWNATEAHYPRNVCVHQLFEEQVERSPDATALVFEHEQLTYAELNRRANQLAHHLRGLGVGPDAPVGLCLQRSVDLIVGLLGILKAGGAYVPLDPALPVERLTWMLQDSGARVVVTEESLAQVAHDSAVCVCVDRDDPAISRHSQINPTHSAQPHNLVYVIYTSGSTGRPKGVEVEHRQLLNYVQGVSDRLGLRAGASYASVSTLAADLGNTMVFPSLCLGGCLHLISSERGMDGVGFGEYLASHHIDCLKIVPSHLWALLGEGAEASQRLPREVLVLGGEASSWELVARIQEASPSLRVFNHYGPTETTVGVLTYAVEPGADPQTTGSLTVPVGRPLPNSRVYVLNAFLQPVPAGSVGELYIGGTGVSRGYLGRAELTQERFVADPFSPESGARLYRTGDLVRYHPDGNVEFVGRVDNQVKIRGFRIELGEIESVLLQHPGVREAVVLAREDVAGDKRLVAYLVGQAGAVSVSALRAHLTAKLPEYMVPSAWVALDQLPLTANGKVDRKALPAPEQQGPDEGYVPARTPIEEGLAEIWREVLRVEEAGVHTSFFSLGGHSLLATQVISRIRNTFSVELPLRALFEAPTIAGLAARISAGNASDGAEAPALVRVPRESRMPLSFAQRRLWFIDQLEPNSSVYNIPMALRLSGAVDMEALARSLEEIVGRHESLRTTFVLEVGVPCQVIRETVNVSLPVTDLTALAGEEREHEARRLIAQEAQRPFDLSNGPLFRFGVLRLGTDEHILLLTLHHIVSDGWSQGVLRRELSALYNAFSSGAVSPLSSLPVQYADYAAWQREWLQGEALERQVGYWTERLSGAPALLELPTDRPRPPVQTFRGARAHCEFSAQLTAGLKALGQREGTTLFMTLLAAFQTLLARYSGQDDVVVGTPIANRTQAEIEGVIGFFVNMLALRTDMSGDPSFLKLLGRVREVALGGYAHQYLPFEKLVDELRPERNLSHSPIFQVMFVVQNGGADTVQLQGLQVDALGVAGVNAKFDMLLGVSERDGSLRGTLEYNTDLFESATIERLLGHFQTLLEAVVADPIQRLSQLPMLTESERQQLAEFNATHRDYDLDGPVHQLIEEQALRTPDALALVFEDQQLTYSQLNARANRLAHLLRSRGVGPDTLVGLHLQRSIEMVVGILAVLKAGGAYVPFDPSYPKERLAFMLEDAGVPLLLTQRSLVTSLPPAFATSALAIEEAETRALSYSEENPQSGVDAHHLAYMIYTSGSTGQPKGALNTHRGIRNRLLWMQEHYPLDGSDRVLQKTPFSFDVSVWEFLWPLLSGACLVVARPEGHKDPSYLVEVIQSARITTLHFVPSMLRVFVEAQGVQGCVSVRRVICSGEALAWDLTQRFFSGLSGSELHNLYGPTEAAVDVTYYACSASEAGPSIPIGRAIANTQIHLLDRFGSLVPIGVPGELYIGGVNVGRGYHNRVELSAEKFVLDPFIGDGVSRMYRTGDLCRYLWDGTLEYLGRLDHQVKLRGFRIELGEIESVLLQHASVLDAVVVVREEEPGEKRLVGYVVSEASQTPPSVSELREHLLQTLPDYMVPSAFVMLEALPLSPNGKVDRKALPAPDMARPDLSMGYTAPSTPTEEALARIWCEVLRLEQVGIHDNFFELGGDSILSIQIIARANAAGLRLTPRQVFQHQSIASLASVAGTQEVLQSEQGAVSGSVPLTPIQHWFLEQERVEAHHFNQSRLLTLRERVSVDHLKAVACALVSHHDALRLRFVRSAEGWEQSNAAEQSDEFFSVVDLSGVSAADRSAAITAVCTQLQSSLDLQEGPLLRVCYFELGAEEPARLFLMIHHLGVDGVSWRVLLEDLATGMEQLRSGEAISLPAKTTSFQQWSRRLVGYANSASVLSDLDHWKAVSRSEVSPLPVDFASGSNTVASERVVRVSLDTEETRALLSEVPAVYHTQINDALLTALARSVGSWTGDRRVLVDLEGHGREALFAELDVSRTLGWFTSLYPVLLELAPSSDWGESLKGVKESLRGVPNRGLGYGVLRYLSPDAEVRQSLSGGSGAQISFNYHGQMEIAAGGSTLLGAATESGGPVHSPQALRTHLINIICHVSQGRLHLGFSYSEAVHAHVTVRGLAESYLESLRELIAHCQLPEAGGYTPSDFPRARLNQQILDRLVKSIGPPNEDLVEDIYPLAPMQSGILFHSIFATERAVYLDHLLYSMSGQVDRAAFERAWETLIGRHPLFRTSFHWAGLEDAIQVVHRNAYTPLDYRDWRHLSADEQEASLDALRMADRDRGMNLSTAPLMRLTLISTGSDSCKFLWTVHHLVIDRWSVALVMKELTSVYEAIRQGRSIDLSVLSPYGDYIGWLQQQSTQRAETYWRRVLSGFTSPTALPIDKTPGAMAAGHMPERLLVRLSEETSSGLQAFSRQHRLTLSTLAQGAWALLLSRYSGEEDVLFGVTLSGRPSSLPGAESMVGTFINSLPVRARISGSEFLPDWLQQLQEAMLELQEYEYSSLTQVQSCSAVPRGIPLFDSLVIVQNTPATPTRERDDAFDTPAGELRIDTIRGDSSADFPLYLTVVPDLPIRMALNYDATRYDAGDAQRLLNHFTALLEGMVADPYRSIDRLPMLTESERQQLAEFNATHRDYDLDGPVHQLIEEQALRTPDALALVFEDQQLTYSQLNARANRLAHLLRSRGVGPDTLVGLHLQRSIEMVVGILAVLKAGGAYVPFDPSYPKERLAFMLEDAGVPLLLTQRSLVTSLPPAFATSALAIEEAETRALSYSEENPQSGVDAHHLAYMIYTSGSTGQPKGALNTHRGIRNRLLWMQEHYPLDGSDRVLQKTPFSFDVSVWEFLWPLLSGACLVVARPEGHKDPSYLVEVIQSARITTLHFVPSMLRVFVEAQGVQGCVSVRRVICSGEALAWDLTQRFFSGLSGSELHNLYGPTEAAVDVTYYACSASDAGPSIPIGRAIANTQIHLLDRFGSLVPIGVPGELYIGGVNVGRGYHNRVELSAEKFVLDPFIGDGVSRMYRTGDLCRYLWDGTLEYLGRLDHQVKLRGFRIELGEIESVLLSHPMVRDAVVVAREEEPGEKRLVGYVVSEASQTPPSVSELREHLLQTLPDYMVPSAFVMLEALPLSPNGKVDRKALPAPQQQGQDEGEGEARTPVEEGLVEIWREILRIQQAGVHTSFFELGGHSLLATQVISRIRNTFAVELPLRALFEAPTIAGLAARIALATGQEGPVAPPLARTSREGRLPLSFAQQRLWFIDQLEPGSAVYNIPVALRLLGTVDVAALERSLEQIVGRHEALRTTFDILEADPFQVIHDAVAVALPVVDLSSLSAEERESEARRLITQEAQRPFDLCVGPLFRFGLLRLGEEEHVLLLTLHHIVSDGWSQGVLRRELQSLYNALHAGRPSPLAELALQYADYAAWQREWLQGEELERQLRYWKSQMAGAPALLELPTDRPRPAVQTSAGARVRGEFSAELTAALKALGQREGTTLFMTLLAAFQTLLWRYSHQDDIVVGTPIANRTQAETEGVIGFFVNTLALRADVSGDPSFAELLGRVREVCLVAYAHQDLPFEKLVEEIHPHRSLSYSPVFQVMFSVANAAGAELTLEGLEIERVGAEGVSAKFDLSVSLSEAGGTLGALFEYNTDLFDEERIQHMLGHLQRLLEGIVSEPTQKISRLPLLTEPEREQVLVSWNDTAAPYPADRCLHELFDDQVELRPDAIAVVFGDQHLTYAQLNRRANQLAHYLQQRGVGPDVLVGLCVERSLEMVVGLLGILKAGGAYVPLDPSYPPERLQFMLENSQATLLLTQTPWLNALPDGASQDSGAKNPGAQRLCLDDEWVHIGYEPETAPAVDVSVEHPAYVIYTSGSTGRPKGVVVTHRGLANIAANQHRVLGIGSGERIVQFASMSFDACVFDLVMALCSGSTLYLASLESLLPGAPLTEFLNRHAITAATLPPTALSLLQSEEIPSLRVLSVAGEACPPELAARWSSGRRFFNLYGPTEATIWATGQEVESGSRVVTIGRPIGNTRVYVLDERGEPVPVGVSGELYLGGLDLARGYLNRADLTAERFVPDPFSGETGSRLYRTGDLCRYLWDGTLEYLGRLDHQVKIRGFRIELGEIESVLLQHASVLDAVVVVREEEPGEKRLVGYVVSEASQTPPSVSELREHLLQTLPDYMVPSAFVMLEALPLSPNGKVDRKALPAPQQQGQDEGEGEARTPVEEGLVEIWREILRIQQAGVHTSFFELGGHSLLATQVISRIRNTFAVELPLRALFEAPTIAGLAARIALATGQEGPVAPPLARTSREGRLPLSFAQQRLWFIDQLEPGSAVYNIPMALRLLGTVDVAALERSLEQIVGRHEALRTTFDILEADPFQVIHDAVAVALPVVDLSSLSAEERESEARRLITQEAQRPFDLCVGPLFRFGLLRLGEEEHVLLLTLHHIVSDGWSQGVLRRELQSLYNALHAGRPSPLAELALQYADYAAWQREWLQGEELERQLRYWKSQMAGAPALLELPTDRPRPAVQTSAGARVRGEFSAELTAALKALGQREGTTLFMTLLAAFQTLLWRYSHQDDIVVGTPIANRTQAETEGVIGFFVNTLALRADVSGDPSFAELLGRVREVCLVAYAHQDLPFEKLVEEIHPHRSLSYSPVFQVMFSVANAAGAELTLEGLEIERVGAEGVSAKFDLSVSLSEAGGTLGALFEYNTDLFDEERIQHMLGHFQTLLQALVEDPIQRLSRIPMLTQTERHHLLVEGNASATVYPPQPCLHQLFEQQVQRTPDAIALVFEEHQLTYAQLNARANQLAHSLRERGVAPEALVGVCLQRTPEMIVAVLGILKAGGAYVPLDPAYPPERLAFMLQDAHLALVLTRTELLAALPPSNARLLCLDDEALLTTQSCLNPTCDVRQDNLAYVIYTSGSTGRPKGTQITHANVTRLMAATQDCFHFDERDVWTLFHSLAFDFSVWELWGPLLYGGTLVVVPYWVSRSPDDFLELLRRHRVTVLNQTPSAFRQLLGRIPATDAGKDLAIRRVIFGGEALEPASLQRWYDLYGPQDTRLINMYGITETTVHVTYREMGFEDVALGRGSLIGCAIADLRLYVLGAWMQPVPVGVSGEIYVGGGGVARGYLGRAELTAQRFVPDPFSGEAGSRLYRSGDLARYLWNGELEYLGRADDQVKIRGFRIELGEIESVLAQHPGIREVVVLAREDVPGEKRLVAYAVTETSTTPPSVSELREHLLHTLPEYMVPSAFVMLEALPLSPNGKVDRKALPAPEPSTRQTHASSELPATPDEELVGGIWADVLGVPTVSVEQDFFELGGHSLLAARVITRLREAFNVELPLRLLFDHPSVRGLAREIEALRSISALRRLPPILPVERDRPLPLSFAQQRLWLVERIEPGSYRYNAPKLIRLRGPLVIDALRRAFEEIVCRHEVLRTAYSLIDGIPMQIISEPGPIDFPIIDMSALPESIREPESIQFAISEVRRPFDLSEGPVFRSILVKLDEQDYLLALAVHHIAYDAQAEALLQSELETLYAAYSAGLPSPLTTLLVQYADYAVWQREWMQDEVLDELIAFWQTQLGGAPAALRLPYDRPHPAVETHEGAVYPFALNSELTADIVSLTRRSGLTLFMTLLAAYQILLYRYSGQSKIPVGTDVANRNRPETEHLFGCFVNQLVLCSSCADDPTVLEFLNHVREVCLGAYAHQELPFDVMVAKLVRERESSVTPIFQAKFVLRTGAAAPLSLQGLISEPVPIQREGAKFDLTLTLVENNDEIRCMLEYRTSVFDPSTIARMADRFSVMLKAMVDNPNQRLSDLPLLDNRDLHTISPSDFAGAGLTRQDLENIILQLRGNEPE